jgi:squalene-associated FAD-dependent desaturase
MNRTVAIVGAGWSGLACAVALTRAGVAVTVLDAAPAPGGRGRTLELDLAGRRLRVDNGQHLLLGACTAVLEVMRAVGADPARLLDRRPFGMQYGDGWGFTAARAIAPLHLGLGLVRARAIPWPHRRALARWAIARRLRGWRAVPGASVADALADLPPALVERLWRPLCLAVMNVAPDQADAGIFLNVVRDSLGAGASACDLLLARAPLSDLFPGPAAAWLRAHGAQVRLREPVQSVEPRGDGTWGLRLRQSWIEATEVVLALPPHNASALLRSVPASRTAAGAAAHAAGILDAIGTAPIATAYLAFDGAQRLERPMLALREQPSRGAFGQWVFDRGASDHRLAGILSVVVSGEGPHMALEQRALGEALARQLTAELGLPAPRAIEVIVEKRATIRPAPGLVRPAPNVAPGLFLAGDSSDSPYPSTLEGSVRSGVAAARHLLGQRTIR